MYRVKKNRKNRREWSKKIFVPHPITLFFFFLLSISSRSQSELYLKTEDRGCGCELYFFDKIRVVTIFLHFLRTFLYNFFLGGGGWWGRKYEKKSEEKNEKRSFLHLLPTKYNIKFAQIFAIFAKRSRGTLVLLFSPF